MIRIIGDIILLLMTIGISSTVLMLMFSMALPVIIGNFNEAKKKIRELQEETEYEKYE